MDIANHAALGSALGLSPMWSVAPDAAWVALNGYLVLSRRITLGAAVRYEWPEPTASEARLIAAARIMHSPIVPVMLLALSTQAAASYAAHILIDAFTHGATALVTWPTLYKINGPLDWGADVATKWKLTCLSILILAHAL